MNPINRDIMRHAGPQWGTWANLIPESVENGMSGAEMSSRLREAGFTEATRGEAWRYVTEIDAGREVFIRNASRFPCNVVFYVVVELNEQGGVRKAKGTQHEHGCL
jgi:hypothetical protein